MSSLKLRFILVFSLFVLLSCTIISVFSCLALVRTSSDLASRQGYPILEKASSVIDGDAFEAFCQNPSEDDPYYEKTRLALLEIKNTVGCQYLYTMIPLLEGQTARYIIDGSCDPSDTENFSPLGTDEDISSYGSSPWEALAKGGMTCSGLEKQDEWGWIVSSYRAIKNSSGRVIGFIGVDFDMTEFVSIIKMQIIIIAILGISFVLLGIGIVTMFTSSIFGKMNTVSEAMENISKGTADLTARIPEGGGTELAALAANCNHVISSLNTLVKDMQAETGVLSETGQSLKDKMKTHIKGINSADNNMSDIALQINSQKSKIESITGEAHNVNGEIAGLDSRLMEQSTAIRNASSAVTEITASINSVTRHIETIISEYALLVQDSSEGRKLQDEVSEKIKNIAEQSENLTEANEAIAAIAEQTDLLAMNAAIEAAHAGDAGKGFAVVADEIRQLAETSSTQSDEIKKLLGGISNAIMEIVTSSQKSAASFESVGTKILQLDGLIKEVRDGMREQNIGVESISSTMQTLDSTTAEITSTSALIKDATRKLSSGAQDLDTMAVETKKKSEETRQNMEDMRQSAMEVVKATNLSNDATKKVSDMINGFKV
ncbi:MAG: methyl-accepting chemotaxis protein [Treponema sp.]|nr:methyl-accepting chemotaxis protein [Treponema sp.]